MQKTLNNDDTDFEFNGDDFGVELFEEGTPGIGYIVPDDNIIVPLYNNSDLTTIMKEDNAEQLGSGLKEEEPKDQNESNTNVETKEKAESENTNISKDLNTDMKTGTKRKEMDDSIHESFMHPKLYKTKTYILENENTKTNTKKESEEEKKDNLKKDIKVT